MTDDLFRGPGIRVRTGAGSLMAYVHVGVGSLPAVLTARQAMELGAALLGFGLAVNGKDQAMVDDINAVIRKHTGDK